MRIQTLLSATGDSVVESYVAIAKQEAQAAAKASGGGMAAIREAVEKAETETRAKYENGAQSDLSGIDVTGLSAAVDVYTEAVRPMQRWRLRPALLMKRHIMQRQRQL